MTKRLICCVCIIAIYIGFLFATQIAAKPIEDDACICSGNIQKIPESQKEGDTMSNLISTKAGETISITLDSNPTTGYQWQLANPVDEKVLKLISSVYRMPETNMVGAGGKEVWTFKALSGCQTTINFEYVRPWEKDKEPAKKATFTIIIQ